MEKNMMQKSFEAYLDNAIQHKRYVKLQYFTDFHEFISLMAVTEKTINKHDTTLLMLNTGEEIKIDNIVKIDDVYAPKYVHIADYTCDC